MRDRFVTWGTRDEQRRLFTFELDAEEARIRRRVLPAADSSEDLLQTILNAWTQHAPIAYPAGTDQDTIELTATGTIVPDGAEVDDKVRVASAEREWPFDVVSARLRKQFEGELEELRDVIAGLEAFDEAVFERLKGAWNKVTRELTNKVLRYEHTHGLKKLSDELFARMKDLRRGKVKRVRSQSKELKREFSALLKGAEERLGAKADPRKLFGDLRSIQDAVNKSKLAKEDRGALRKQLDHLFKAVKSEMDASGATSNAVAQRRQRLEARLKGLEGAIKRMRHSVERDGKDKYYENKRRDRAQNQLAQQLAAAKLLMIEEKTDSKQAKLDDMLATKAKLDKELARLVKKEAALEKKREAAQRAREAARPIASTDAAGATRKRGGRQRRAPGVSNKLIRDTSAVLGAVLGAPASAEPAAGASAAPAEGTEAAEGAEPAASAEMSASVEIAAGEDAPASAEVPPTTSTSSAAEPSNPTPTDV